MFSPFEARLSHVYRWPITRTIQRQSVAEHSFRVALWADRIAKHHFHITNATILYHIGRAALLHDQLEAFTGDAPSTVKAHNWDTQVYDRMRNKIVEHYVEPEGDIKKIIKIADICEALVFLHEERTLGNGSMTGLMQYLCNKLKTMVPDPMYAELTQDCENAAAYRQEPLDD